MTKLEKFLLVGVFVVVGAVVFWKSPLCQKVQAAACSPNQATTQETVYGLSEIAPGYWHYSPDALKLAQENGKVVLYFWAPWCSTCASLEQELLQGDQQIPDGVTVLKINYDHSSELKEKYSVVTQHTFVQIDQNGELISSWVGGEIDAFSQHLQ